MPRYIRLAPDADTRTGADRFWIVATDAPLGAPWRRYDAAATLEAHFSPAEVGERVARPHGVSRVTARAQVVRGHRFAPSVRP